MKNIVQFPILFPFLFSVRSLLRLTPNDYGTIEMISQPIITNECTRNCLNTEYWIWFTRSLDSWSKLWQWIVGMWLCYCAVNTSLRQYIMWRFLCFSLAELSLGNSHSQSDRILIYHWRFTHAVPNKNSRSLLCHHQHQFIIHLRTTVFWYKKNVHFHSTKPSTQPEAPAVFDRYSPSIRDREQWRHQRHMAEDNRGVCGSRCDRICMAMTSPRVHPVHRQIFACAINTVEWMNALRLGITVAATFRKYPRITKTRSPFRNS